MRQSMETMTVMGTYALYLSFSLRGSAQPGYRHTRVSQQPYRIFVIVLFLQLVKVARTKYLLDHLADSHVDQLTDSRTVQLDDSRADQLSDFRD